MPESGPPNARTGPSQGLAGGPPSTKVAGGAAPPGGGHAPIASTSGARSASTRAEAPWGEDAPAAGEATGEYSTETGEYRAADGEVSLPGGPEEEPRAARREEPPREGELSAETLADPGLG